MGEFDAEIGGLKRRLGLTRDPVGIEKIVQQIKTLKQLEGWEPGLAERIGALEDQIEQILQYLSKLEIDLQSVLKTKKPIGFTHSD